MRADAVEVQGSLCRLKRKRTRQHVDIPAESPAGGRYPLISGMGTILSPRSYTGIAGMGIGGDRGGDGGVIPGHPRPRCHLDLAHDACMQGAMCRLCSDQIVKNNLDY
jgi:hypothetical protein